MSRLPARARRAGAIVLGGLAAATTLAACSGSSGHSSQSVFSVSAGECFQGSSKVQAQLSSLQRTRCTQPHTQEAYAVVRYTPPTTSSSPTSTYPGSDALATFAQGSCAQRFTGYVGVNYLDSTLFFTYLMPSARSWEQDDDRNIICFVMSTGQPLTASVKGSKR